MKRIEIDEDIYTYIAANTEHIGESASDILRRLLKLERNQSGPDSKPENAALNKPGSVFDVMTSEDLATEKSAVSRFLFILSMLYRSHNEEFRSVLDIKGRDRIYFATSEEALLTSGNSTNPKQIPQSPYWVITNNNTTKKKSMLTSVARQLGYSDSNAEKIRDFL